MNKEQTGSNVFRNRNYCLMFLGDLISNIGYALYSFVVGFYILDISGNNAMLQGTFIAVCSAAMLLAMPFGGVIGDRSNKVRVMTLCQMLTGILLIVLALIHGSTENASVRIAAFFIVGIAGNILAGIYGPASSALLPFIVEEDRIQQATAYNIIRSSMTGIFGAALAGALYSLLPMSVLLAGVGVCYILSGISVLFIRYEESRTDHEPLSAGLFFSDMKEGFRYLGTQKALIALLSSILFINFFSSPALSNFMPYFVVTDVANAPSYVFDRYIKPEQWSSVFSILLSVSQLAASVILSGRKQKEKCGREAVIWLCVISAAMIVFALGYWVLVVGDVSLSAFLILMAVVCLVFAASSVCINIPISTVMMRIVDRDMLGKVSSITSTLSQCMVPMSSVMAGAVLQSMGSAALLAVCAAGFTAVTLMLLFNKEVKNI